MGLLRLKNSKGQWTPVSTLDIDAIATSGFQYSEDEVCIGCWTNGKPIYRKTIKTGSITFSTSEVKTIPINASIENVVDFKGFGYVSDGSVSLFPYIIRNSANKTIGVEIKTNSYSSNANIIWMGNGSESSRSFTDIVIILEYTKTTDAENSFTLDMLSSAPTDIEATENDVNDVLFGGNE